MNRRLPANLPAEEALIGCVLIQSHPMEELSHVVAPDDFLKPSHNRMWTAILALHDEGQAIDPVTVAARSHLPLDEVVPLMAATPAVSAWRTYASQVVEVARKRHLILRLSQLADLAFGDIPVDEIIPDVEALGNDALVGSRAVEISGLFTGVEFQALAPERAVKYPWLIPGIVRQRWRQIIVGPEGCGKMVLLRQIALHAAAGRDPFNPGLFLSEAVPTLVMDMENPETAIEHQHEIVNQQHGVNLIAEAGDNFHLWHQDAGINIRKRLDQARFEAVLQRCRPKLVVIGPFYKTFRRNQNEDMEQVTLEVLSFLDLMRTRYNFALMLEHHLPKGQGMYRTSDPFGSSALMRWPEMGIALQPDGPPNEMDVADFFVKRFRNDREVANWPNVLTKNKPMTSVAWSGTWEHGR